MCRGHVLQKGLPQPPFGTRVGASIGSRSHGPAREHRGENQGEQTAGSQDASMAAALTKITSTRAMTPNAPVRLSFMISSRRWGQ